MGKSRASGTSKTAWSCFKISSTSFISRSSKLVRAVVESVSERITIDPTVCLNRLRISSQSSLS